MYVRAVMPQSPPLSFVGSWITTFEFLKHLHARGHDVAVTAYLATALSRFDIVHEGISVQGHFRDVGRPDVVIGHAGDDGSAADIAQRTGAPLVLMAHGGKASVIREKLAPARLAVFNSSSLQADVDWDGESIVAHPPVSRANYETEPGDRVTLVNLSERKGSLVFWELARRMPDVGFLAVRGNYGDQLYKHGNGNVALQNPTDKMREDVYARTKVLLMPSETETWGRVAMEAACSGIPTIAHPTNGVYEALGQHATYVDREDIEGWERALRRLLDPVQWASASFRARKPLRNHRPEAALNRFAKAVEERCAAFC